MKHSNPITSKLARFHLSRRNPTAPVAFNVETCTLTLANGDLVNLFEVESPNGEHPATFNEACTWLAAIRAGQPVPAIERSTVIKRRLIDLIGEFGDEARERLLAFAEDLEDERWGRAPQTTGATLSH